MKVLSLKLWEILSWDNTVEYYTAIPHSSNINDIPLYTTRVEPCDLTEFNTFGKHGFNNFLKWDFVFKILPCLFRRAFFKVFYHTVKDTSEVACI